MRSAELKDIMKNMDETHKLNLNLIQQAVCGNEKAAETILHIYDHYINGFQGFQLREKPGAQYVYQLVREDGSIAKGLSEGERHFIAFLYFYHTVMGSQMMANAEKKL